MSISQSASNAFVTRLLSSVAVLPPLTAAMLTQAAAQTKAQPAQTKEAPPVEGSSPGGLAAADGAAGPAAAPPPSDAGQNLGAHLADPRWFRKTMFGDEGKAIDTKRSQADEQGRFSSLIRFELPTMTPEACADHLQKKVADEVSNVERKAQPDGRIQLDGSTDRYKITFICGQAEGKTIAYVSYQWT